MKSRNNPIAKSEMLIRKPVSEVFEALINPDVTSEFWFTEGSDRLEPDKSVKWTWGQFGIHATIRVTAIERNRLIAFQWPADEESSSYRTVEISFGAKSKTTTFVRVVESGFDRDDENLIENISGQTEGWTLVLSGMKAWLEYGINLNLISDHKPE